MPSNWRNPPRPVEKSAEQGSRITVNTGKSVDGERDSAGSVVERKRSNVRVLSIPAIRARVVQGALKLILEPIFEADFQPGSYGYRPKRTAHEAVARVASSKALLTESPRNFA